MAGQWLQSYPLNLIVASLLLGYSLPASPASAYDCAEPNFLSTKYVDCDRTASGDGDGSVNDKWRTLQLAEDNLADDMRVVVEGECRLDGIFTITDLEDVLIESADGKLLTVLRDTGNPFSAFLIKDSDRVLLRNLRLMAEGTQDEHKFQEGVEIEGSVQDITLDRVQVLAATLGSGIEVTASGDDVCISRTLVHSAGKDGSAANGYRIVSSSSLTGLEFEGAWAVNNKIGFAMDQSSAVVDAKFHSHVGPAPDNTVTNTIALANGNTGFTVKGGTTVLLDVASRDNGADGIRIFNSAERVNENETVSSRI